MNRIIKFRGRDVVTKRLVYGFYCKCGDTGLSTILTFKKGFQGFFPVVVDPDTVAQLVGYDKNEKEVYEGDTIVRDDGSETVVDYRDNPAYVHLHTLKEVSTPR